MKWFNNLLNKIKQSFEPLVEDHKDEVIRLGKVLSQVDNSTYTIKDYETKPTEFELAREKFNPSRDILVISYSMVAKLDEEDQKWLEKQGNKIIYFGSDSLVNVAIVRAGYGW